MHLPCTFLDSYFGFSHPTFPPSIFSIYTHTSLLKNNPKLSSIISSPHRLFVGRFLANRMEKTWPNTTSYHSHSLAEPIGFLFLYVLFSFASKLPNFSWRFLSSLLPYALACSTITHAERTSTTSKRAAQTQREDAVAREELSISREDLELVMERMRMTSCAGEEEEEDGSRQVIRDLVGVDELTSMFQEEEPSLEEVSEAFAVFDANRDGFIDAVELHGVLSELGFGEGSDIEACHRMIAAHDDNGDGRIDFNEFLRFMESCFC